MKVLDKIMEFMHIGNKSSSASKWEADAKAKVGDAVWIKVSPAHPDVGISCIAGDKTCPWPHAIKVTGVSQEVASSSFLGKVIDWALLSKEDIEKIEKRVFSVAVDQLKRLFR